MCNGPNGGGASSGAKQPGSRGLRVLCSKAKTVGFRQAFGLVEMPLSRSGPGAPAISSGIWVATGPLDRWAGLRDSRKSGKPVETSSRSNLWVCLDWRAGKPPAACLRVRRGGWKGPGGEAIAALFPSGRGTAAGQPLEQQVFRHGSSDHVFGLDLWTMGLGMTGLREPRTAGFTPGGSEGFGLQMTSVSLVPRRQECPSGHVARTPRPMHLTPLFFLHDRPAPRPIISAVLQHKPFGHRDRVDKTIRKML